MWLFAFAAALGCAGAAHAIELRLIGVQTLPVDTRLAGQRVGGISGLDYDAARGDWIAVSDVRAESVAPRAFRVELDYDATSFTAARATEAIALRREDGVTLVDVEAGRIDPRDGVLWCASEGESKQGIAPAILRAMGGGGGLRAIALPAELAPGRLRANQSFESLAFAADGASLWLGLEAPTSDRETLPTATRGGVTTLYRLAREGAVLARHEYPLDAWQLTPAEDKPADNGLSELLALPGGGLLALERSGTENAGGTWRFGARLYEVTVADGAAAKRLVYDFAQAAPRPVDNLEALAWGRRLPNGNATLVVASDDNFSATQQTQFWVFEVVSTPRPKRHYDDVFPGVVHDAQRIAGFVGEYRWLSNFFPCRVEWEGRVYGSSEAAYQSAKYPAAERDVFVTLDPDAAKKLSRAKPYDTAAWEQRKERVMREVVGAKFSQDPELARKLAATGERHLEETNWWGDKVWGVFQGEGENKLGRILMETRTRLRERPAR